MMKKPALLITIDTEGDNIWLNRDTLTTRNARFLPRFQQLCEKYQFKPVYLTNYEMARDACFTEFARDVLARGKGEVGMHLHAWNSPPHYALTEDDQKYQPYLVEYPHAVMRQKIEHMTHLLEDTFQMEIVSHRAGRWSFDARYAALLVEYGYRVDCSVTPCVDWRFSPGDPSQQGGADYRHFPRQAYFINMQDIARPGCSSLLEVPMSTRYKHGRFVTVLQQAWRKARRISRPASVRWVRPTGSNQQQMQDTVLQCLAEGCDHIEFMLHSSEFMPGGSPTFKDAESVERLYDDLEQFFSWMTAHTSGMTLAEYYQYKRRQREAEQVSQTVLPPLGGGEPLIAPVQQKRPDF